MSSGFRLSLIHYTGHALLDRLEPSPQMRKKYWDVFESRAVYRANVTPPYDAELKVDLSWRAGWPRSMSSFFAWVEDIALKGDYYLQLRAATRHSKSPVGFMEYYTVATKWGKRRRLAQRRTRGCHESYRGSYRGARGCAWRGRRRRRCRCACAVER